MQIIVSHITRMQKGYVCVAGIDAVSGNHIRPVLNYGRLSRTLIRKDGGPFEIGAVVDLGKTKAVGRSPELEDHEFDPANARWVKRLKPAAFWELLVENSKDRLVKLFGDDLEKRDSGQTINVGKGKASLGNLRPAESPVIQVDWRGKIRCTISDTKTDANLSVTDLRLYKSDQVTSRASVIAKVNKSLEAGKVILALGVARAWTKPGDTEPRHWLQLNNLHLEADPLGEMFDF